MSFLPTSLISDTELQRSAEILRALAHPLRMQILEFIDQNDMINVNKIYSALELEQSITSQHLRILRQADLVQTERRGKFIHYRINRERLLNSIDAIKQFEQKVETEGDNSRLAQAG